MKAGRWYGDSTAKARLGEAGTKLVAPGKTQRTQRTLRTQRVAEKRLGASGDVLPKAREDATRRNWRSGNAFTEKSTNI